MIRQFKDLSARLGWKRARERRVYAFEESLDKELVGLAEKRKVPVEKFVSDLVTNALTKLKKKPGAGGALGDAFEARTTGQRADLPEVHEPADRGEAGSGGRNGQDACEECTKEVQYVRKLEMMTALKEWDFFGMGEKEDR